MTGECACDSYRYHERRSARVPSAVGSWHRRYTSTPVNRGLQPTDVGQIAVALVVIQSIADHELRRNVETDVLHVDVDLHRFRLAEQGDDGDRGRIAAL